MEDEFDLGHIESKAFEYAHLATIADNEKRLEAALIYYKVKQIDWKSYLSIMID